MPANYHSQGEHEGRQREPCRGHSRHDRSPSIQGSPPHQMPRSRNFNRDHEPPRRVRDYGTRDDSGGRQRARRTRVDHTDEGSGSPHRRVPSSRDYDHRRRPSMPYADHRTKFDTHYDDSPDDYSDNSPQYSNYRHRRQPKNFREYDNGRRKNTLDERLDQVSPRRQVRESSCFRSRYRTLTNDRCKNNDQRGGCDDSHEDDRHYGSGSPRRGDYGRYDGSDNYPKRKYGVSEGVNHDAKHDRGRGDQFGEWHDSNWDNWGDNESRDCFKTPRTDESRGCRFETDQRPLRNDGNLDALAEALEAMNIQMDESTGTLVTFVRNFYHVHPTIKGQSQDQVEALREEHNIHIISGREVPRPVPTIELAGFPTWVETALTEMFSLPTPIQMQGWPIALSGRDVYGIAETGSGKTLAFLCPAFVHIAAQPPLDVSRGDGPIGLIISPTRELALQIHKEVERFAPYCRGESAIQGGVPLRLRSTAVYGGSSNTGELGRRLTGASEICVACPGRLMDLMNRGLVKTNRVTYLVFDEADMLLSLGFAQHMKAISRVVRTDRQTSMWSATWTDEVNTLARSFCQMDPIHVNIGCEGIKTVQSIKQTFINMDTFHAKISHLVGILTDNLKYRWVVFVNTKKGSAEVDTRLKQDGIKSACLTGDKSQEERHWAITNFRSGKIQVLVGTDVLSRGLDIENIYGVVNFDMPNDLASYTHRIGRCGRAGRPGYAISYYRRDPVTTNLCREIQRSIVENRLQISSITESLEEAISRDDYDGGFGDENRYNAEVDYSAGQQNDRYVQDIDWG